ncbi:13322_t:CDS:1, partial [Funneliformis geosporum]
TAKLDQSDNEEEYEEEDTENPPSSISLFEVLKKIEPEYPLLTLNCRFDSLLTEQMDFKFTIVKVGVYLGKKTLFRNLLSISYVSELIF